MQEKTRTSPKRKLISIGNVAFLLLAAMLVSQLLGFLRTRLVNANFSAVGPESTGAYFAAFVIPDFFFYTLSAGVLGVAFIPVLADRLHKGDRKGMWELCSSLLNLLCIVMFAVAVVIFVFAEPLIGLVAPNLTPEQMNNAVTIMRFLALNPLLFTLSGVLTSVQQTMGRFFFFAIAPLFYNLSIIASVYLFRDTSLGLTGLGIGAFVGGLLQLGVVSLGLIGVKFRWRPKIMWRRSDFRTVLRQLPPRSLDQGIDQVQSAVETRFSSRLGTEYISYYNNAYMLQTAPVMLVGTSIATAAFPRMASRLSQGRPDLFRKEFLKILRFMIWVIIPIVIVCWFARGYLARLIFAQESPEISLIFGFLTGAIFFRTLYAIMSRWFYAQKDTKTPLFVSMFIIVFVVITTYILARPDTYGAAGLAFAVSLAAMIEVCILSTIMVKRDRALLRDREFWSGLGRIVSISGFSVLAGYVAVQLFPLGVEDRGIVTLGTKLALITVFTLGTHVVLSRLFGLSEVNPIFNWIRRIVLRPIRQPFNPHR